MANPFFDNSNFPWHLSEGQALHKILVLKVTSLSTITNIYQRSNGVRPLRPNLNANDLWIEVFDLLARQLLFRRLCDHIINDPTLIDAHAAAYDVIRYDDPVYRGVLSNGELFVDREVLRANLADLAIRATRKSVLLVRAPGCAGKSWTRNLITEQVKSLGLQFTEIAENTMATVKEVVDHLFDMLGASESVPRPDVPLSAEQLETDTAWYRKVCNRLHAIAAQRNEVLWIIVDDIGEYPPHKGPRLHRNIRMFFDQFVLHMSTEAFAQWFRLVLIDYPMVALPSKWEQRILIEDTPSAEDVTEEAVVIFLRRAARHKDKVLPDDEAVKLARKVLQNVAAALAQDATHERLKLIHQELKRVYTTL